MQFPLVGFRDPSVSSMETSFCLWAAAPLCQSHVSKKSAAEGISEVWGPARLAAEGLGIGAFLCKPVWALFSADASRKLLANNETQKHSQPQMP